MKQKIVLADSGGLDTAAAIAWLAAHHDAEVVSVAIDLGQDRQLDHARDRALAGGALRAHVLDARAEFARDFLLPGLRAGALAEGGPDAAAALGRTLTGRKLVEVARIEQTNTVACGGAHAPDIERSVRDLDPHMEVVVIPQHASRSGTAHYRPGPAARLHHVPARVAIAFERGVPVSINGVPMDLVELLESVATIAATQGIGHAEGMARACEADHTICEPPAAIVLHAAHQALERRGTNTDDYPTGVVRLTLSEGACAVEGVERPAVAADSR